MIDAHIHLDMYEEGHRVAMLDSLLQAKLKAHGDHPIVEKVIAVSTDLDSCLRNRQLAGSYPGLVHAAYGYHPEQPLPSEVACEKLFQWIREQAADMIAVGEVGLPYYTALEKRQAGEIFDTQPYLELLEQFVKLAAELNKPIILHAIYEDADAACDLLEKHNVPKAHFHWFKAPCKVAERIIANHYSVSFTPDICYEPDIRQLATVMPIDQIMVETDGPWSFEGPFKGRATEPGMVARVIQEIADLKRSTFDETCELITQNTKAFYQLP